MNQLTVESVLLINELCDQFDHDFLNGRQPKIERFLERAPHCRERLLENLLSAEIGLRQQSKEQFDPSEYLERFPSDQEIVAEVLERSGMSATVRKSGAENLAATTSSVTPCVKTEPQGKGGDLSEENLAPGKLDRYELQERLGGGAFGAVYKAYDPRLKRTVAIKVAHPNVAASAMSVESWAMARFDHERIVRVFDTGRTADKRPYIVSQFVAAQDLRKHLQRGPFGYRTAAQLTAAVADALQYAHQCHVVHRDIKPENILVDDAGRPYLVDFGMALAIEERGSGPSGCGSLLYMPPEQLADAQFVDGTSDVFSLGAVLYELLVGKPPLAGKSKQEILEVLMHGEIQPLRQIKPDVPLELEQICQKALAKLRTDRYQTAGDFAAALRTFVRKDSQPPSRIRSRSAMGAAAAMIAYFAWLLWPPALPDIVDLELAGQAPNTQYLFQQGLNKSDMPLPAGHKIRLYSRTQVPAYHYMIWFDEVGKAHRVWPPKDAVAQKTREAISPGGPQIGNDTQWWPITGKPGFDVIVVGASAKPLTASELSKLDNLNVTLTSAEIKESLFGEFEYPPLARESIPRGPGENPVVSALGVLGEGDAVLQKLFCAYHGCVFRHQ